MADQADNVSPPSPSWSNDDVLGWLRLIEVVFVLAIGGAYLLDGVTGALMAVVQLAICLLITTRIRRRRLEKLARRRTS